jgi:hypothetical protein
MPRNRVTFFRAIRRASIRALTATVAVLCLITLWTSASAHAAANETPVSAPVRTAVSVKPACAAPTDPDQVSCRALIRTDVTPFAGVRPNAAPPGYGPSDLSSAYALNTSTGSEQTVAIVDAFDDPRAESDLAVYRSQYGLPPCTTANGCFRKVDQRGGTTYPAGDVGWAEEESLDINMVSAVCAKCQILLVEADDAGTDNLGAAVNTAVRLGAKFVSNSYGRAETSSDANLYTKYYDHPGVAVTVSSGDSGYGVQYPAASRYVTAVGGTSLLQGSNARGWSEYAWSYAGSGCSAGITKPSWQKDTGCGHRTVADVSAIADPITGVAVYDTYGKGGWLVVGGTSASAPIIASVYALAGTPASGTYPASFPYQRANFLNDVTVDSNGVCSPSYLCTAGPGYDGPTGLGTPSTADAFVGGTGNVVAVTNPGEQTTAVGTPVSLQIQAKDSARGQTLTYRATGLPAGLAINSSTGLISGTATTQATGSVTVTVTDTTSASGKVSFTWTTAPSAGGGITNPGFETGDLAAWTPAGAAASVTTDTPHTGIYAARLGNPDDPTDGDSSIRQTFTVPAGTHRLALWYKPLCPDIVQYDWATATLHDETTGADLTVLPPTCNVDNAWHQVTASITVGHSYTLTLTNHDDDVLGDSTSTEFDDAALS